MFILDGDKIPGADLIVVLGGDSGSRLPRGLDLYRAGRAPHLLVINPDVHGCQKTRKITEQNLFDPSGTRCIK